MPEDPLGEWLLMVDGAARGNPGEAGCGAVVCDDTGAVREELFRYLGRTTNNVAEYEGLLMGLEAVLQLGGRKLKVQSDSELLVRQLNGVYRVKDPKLIPRYQRALSLLQRLETYRVSHIRREYNREADRLANQAIDTALKQVQVKRS